MQGQDSEIVGMIQKLESKQGKIYFKIEFGDHVYQVNSFKNDKAPDFVKGQYLITKTNEKPYSRKKKEEDSNMPF